MEYPAFEVSDWAFAFFESPTEKSVMGNSAATSSPSPGQPNVGGQPIAGARWELKFKVSDMLEMEIFLEEYGLLFPEDKIDTWCVRGTSVLRTKDSPTDISCDMHIVRSGVVSTGLAFGGGEISGYTIIKSDEEWRRAREQNTDADVLVFDSWDGRPTARGLVRFFDYNGKRRVLALFREAAGFDGLTLAHELGHFAGLTDSAEVGGNDGGGHHHNPVNVMFGSGAGTPPPNWNIFDRKELTQCECDKFQKSWEMRRKDLSWNTPVLCPGF